MPQTLYLSKKGCNKCYCPISWNVNLRKSLDTKLPLNLDGIIHDKHSCDAYKAKGTVVQPIGILTQDVGTQPKTTPNANSAIQVAHEENLESTQLLLESIYLLSTKLVDIDYTLQDLIKTIAIVTETIRGCDCHKKEQTLEVAPNSPTNTNKRRGDISTH